MRYLAYLRITVAAGLLTTVSLVLSLDAQEPKGGFAKGAAIVRSRVGESDEFASALLFTRMDRYAVVVNFFTDTPNAIVVQNALVAEVMSFDDLFTRDLIDDSDKAFVAQKKSGLTTMMKRFPKAAPVVKQVLLAVQQYESNIESDQVRFRGGWTTRYAYTARLKTEEDRRVAEMQQLKDKQRAKEEMAASIKLAEEKSKQAEATRKREEEAAQMEKQRLADALAAKTVADEKRRQAEETTDTARREGNLKSRPVALAAQHLLAGFGVFSKMLDSMPSSGEPTAEMKLPAAWNIAAVTPLPRIQGHETSLRAGAAASSTSAVFVHEAGRIIAVQLGVPLRMEKGKLGNATDLRELHLVLSSLDSAVAQWLPFGMVSARTKLELRSLDDDGNATVSRNFDGRIAELSMSEPALHDDGGFYAYLTMSLR